MKPSTEASELEQTDELEEQKGKPAEIWATEPRHPAGKAKGSKMQLKVCRQEWKYWPGKLQTFECRDSR